MVDREFGCGAPGRSESLSELRERMIRLDSAYKKAQEAVATYEATRSPPKDILRGYEEEEVHKVIGIARGFLRREPGFGRHQFGEDLLAAVEKFYKLHQGITFAPE